MSCTKRWLTRIPAWLVSALTLALILWLTLSPDPVGSEDMTLFPGADKLVHFVMFGFLTVVFLFDSQRKHDWNRRSQSSCLLAILVSAAIGGVVEILQEVMDFGRSFEWADMIADFGGSAFFGLLWLALQKHWSSDGKTPVADPAPRRSRWWKIVLKVFGWLLVVLLLVPLLIYIPPVQTALKDIASTVVFRSTGMKMQIGRFRLKFPLDVELDKVMVLDIAGDTMVSARKLVADVRLLPLLRLDVRISRLNLADGYYRMVSPDSSMVMKIKAGDLTVDGKSSADIRNSGIFLNKAVLKNGNVSLFMNVWKKKPSPQDSTSTPFLIKANDLKLQNFTFAMSMLPTIDTLEFTAHDLQLRSGVVDLRNNIVSVARLGAEKGKVTYLTPDPAYVASHPAPVDTVSPPSPPMVIKGGSVSLKDFSALYTVRGKKPVKGFDPGYIKVSGVNIVLSDFFNKASSIRLPIKSISAKERCGLAITSGHGVVAIDSVGLSLDNFRINTLASRVYADAKVPFAAMALDRNARMRVRADAFLGKYDIGCFLPAFDKYRSLLSSSPGIRLILDASGSLSSLNIPVLDLDVPGMLSFMAEGNVRNPLDLKKMQANIAFHGSLDAPDLISRLTGKPGFELPSLRLTGTAEADHETYSADFELLTSAGDLAAVGNVSLGSESYSVNADIRNFDVARFVPDLGISRLTASIKAHGAGFNPVRPHAESSVDIEIPSVVYKNNDLTGIKASVSLADGAYTLDVFSPSSVADLDISARGTLAPDAYTVEMRARVNHIDLQALGITPGMNSGNVDFYLSGSASPGRWLYDLDLEVNNLDWNSTDGFIHLPQALQAKLLATDKTTEIHAYSDQTSASFISQSGLKDLLSDFTRLSESINLQISQKRLDVDEISGILPDFTFSADASGNGLVRQFLTASGMSIGDLNVELAKDSLLKGNISLLGLNTGKMKIDTVSLALQQRNSLIDYRAHMGNAPGTLDEFADVSLSGYVGGNRASLFLNQKNLAGETGYRLGLTAALSDSTISVHFSPLKATIAYMPWKLNADNHIDYAFDGSDINANLVATSKESGIRMKTETLENGDNEFYLNLDNIHIEDFLRMSALAPPITASVNSDLRVRIHDKAILGNGDINIRNFTYDNMRIGDFDMDFKAGMGSKGASGGRASLKINGQPAMTLSGVLRPDSLGMRPENVKVKLTHFPLSVANPFLGDDVARLSGALEGEMKLDGSFARPVLNGKIICDSVSVFIPMIGSSLKFDNDPITVDNNLLSFNDFNIWGVNKNPLTLDGTVDAKKFSDIRFDISLGGKNVQLIGNDRRTRSQIYGKLFVDLAASVRGPMKHFDVNADLSVLNNTDVTYQLQTDASTAIQQTADGDVVKFVQFSDTVAVASADSLDMSMAMRVIANLNLRPGMKATVMLSGNGTDKVQLTPSGSLSFFRNFMGDMRLTGQLNLGEGFARYSLPVVGEKKFDFEPNCYVLWNGDVMNPVLNLSARDNMKVNLQQSGGNTRLVNFDVSLNVSNTLSAPKVVFDLSAQDDITVQNELQSMSPDQRSQQAINLLLYGQYTGPGIKTASASNIAGSALYGFLTSQINSWAAKNIRGVDLSFGVDQYDKSVNGQNTTTTSYSYQVSKSLFNNKFKIVVGGNYSTDASADENFAQNLLSDISFEYMLRQTNTQSMYLKLFRHNGFESIVEGEVTETGVGFVMRRRMTNLRQFFRFRRHRKKENRDKAVNSIDTMAPQTKTKKSTK